MSTGGKGYHTTVQSTAVGHTRCGGFIRLNPSATLRVGELHLCKSHGVVKTNGSKAADEAAVAGAARATVNRAVNRGKDPLELPEIAHK